LTQYRYLTLFSLMILLAFPAAAQDTPTEPTGPQPVVVEVRADDGQRLSGDYYAAGDDAPAILLLHQLYTTRTSWRWVVGPLLDAGYHVLAVDLRGYGQTRGTIDWGKAQIDTQTWLDWLAEQPGVRAESLLVVGSSMGANLALVGCAEAEHCAGAVAIAPGLNYFGVRTEDAVTSGIDALLIYGDRDSRPARAVPQMVELAEAAELDTLTTLVYGRREHGMDLFTFEPDLLPAIIEWLDARR
jgi:pimeloyl-ACP methyl ester carboxylesterase